MKWSSIPITPVNLTLTNTLPIGQSFLWHYKDGVYSRAINNPPRVIFLKQTDTDLHYSAVYPNDPNDPSGEDDVKVKETRAWIEDYFLLRYDLPTLYTEWREKDPGLFARTELDSRAIGVRLLRQDPWECLIGFITSSNNNIARISQLMHKLTIKYSPPLTTIDGITYHPFPPPHTLPTNLENQLRILGFGYRAGFIDSTLDSLRQKFGTQPGDIEAGLLEWRAKPIEEVRENLISLKGVGRKVADCVSLMCLDKLNLIPIDTHLMAIAARHPAFPSRLKGKPMSKGMYDEIQGFLEEKWGELGGWTQTVMFAADLKPKKEKVQGEEGKIRKRKVKEESVDDDLVEIKEEEVKIEDIETRPGVKRTRSAIVAAQIAKLEIKEEPEIKELGIKEELEVKEEPHL